MAPAVFSAGIKISAAIENDFVDAARFGFRRHVAADELGLLRFCFARQIRALYERTAGNERNALIVVYDLSIDVVVRTGNAKTRTACGTRNLATDTTMATSKAFLSFKN